MEIITEELEFSLARRIASGDQKAREELITHYIPLAARIARKFGRNHPQLDNPEGVAMEALVMSVDDFKPDSSYRFPAIATQLIRIYLLTTKYNEGSLIRVPRSVYDAMLCEVKGRPRTGILARPGVLALMEQARLALSQRAIGWSGTSDTLDRIVDPINDDEEYDGSNYNENVSLSDRLPLLWVAMKRLSPRHSEVIRLRYGLDGGKPWTGKKIGEKWGVSRRAVYQAEMDAIDRLREMME